TRAKRLREGQNGRNSRVAVTRSLRHRAALLIGGLIVVVVVALGAEAYGQMRRTAIALSVERLQSVSGELAALLDRSAQALVTQAGEISRSGELASYLRSRGEADESAAMGVLRAAQGAAVAA